MTMQYSHDDFKKTRFSSNANLSHLILGIVLVGMVWLSACTGGSQKTPSQISVKISTADTSTIIQIAPGATVQEAVTAAGITTGSLDDIQPPAYTVLNESAEIIIQRVTESFETEEVIIPFEQQTVRNESLTEGESLLIQPGSNGIQQNTYRILQTDGMESSRSMIKSETVQEAVPEIIMIGVQTPFTPQPIPGRLGYLSSGNAWVMEETTSQRRPVVTSGDLDGRVFSLSPDGVWLLYTRAEPEGEFNINSLWVVNLTEEEPEPVSLGVYNVISYAGWDPSRTDSILFSTVEPRETAPGWQANNDLIRVVINSTGKISQSDTYIEPNSGGIYGWWGTTYSVSNDGEQIAYARPDSIGLVDLENNELVPLVDILPFQTRSDWAWVPGIAWSTDSTILYFVTHQPKTGISDPEASPLFDLSAFITPQGPALNLVSQTGMFAYPAVSPADGRLAYLEAIFPEQSDSSRYRLLVMDQDGSNKNSVFPPEGSAGLEPQQPVWSPGVNDSGGDMIALIYQGNIYLADVQTNTAQQITGDGLISKIDWK